MNRMLYWSNSSCAPMPEATERFRFGRPVVDPVDPVNPVLIEKRLHINHLRACQVIVKAATVSVEDEKHIGQPD